MPRHQTPGLQPRAQPEAAWSRCWRKKGLAGLNLRQLIGTIVLIAVTPRSRTNSLTPSSPLLR